MSCRLLIFDLDGTLVDTGRDITESINFATAPYGLPPLTVEQTIGLVGEGITRLIEKVLGPERMDLLEPVRQSFIEHYTAHIAVFSRPYPFVAETLMSLRGVAKAVISNKTEALSVRLLQKLSLIKYFDLIVGGDTVKEKKPSPEPVLHVLSTLGVDAADAIIIGDSNLDIEAGTRAGLRTVAVSYGYRPRELLAGADYVIDSFSELVPLLTTFNAILERRRESRYPVPETFCKYVEMKISIAGEFCPVLLLDFSEHGFRIKSPVPFDIGSERKCTVAAPRSLNREISLAARFTHCKEIRSGHGDVSTFIAGAEILSVEDELWFRVFRNILQFITERSGQVF